MICLLGIDYGKKRVGFAVATSPIVEPLMVVSLDKAVVEVKRLIDRFGVKAVVVGVSEGQVEKEMRKFVVALKKIIQVPIFYEDETLTSVDAKEKLGHVGVKKRAKPQDAYQAAVILQNFVDAHLPLDQLPKIATMM